ncbi:hypothetical protein LUZ60_012468 [Juncus effusus]|nr:hypothetical protein LUZ60_012468 [Juncus effusus]
MEAIEETSTNTKYKQILSLFDLCWFRHLILFSPPPSPQPARDIIKPSPLPQQLPRHRRTRSYDTNPSFLSPPIWPPRLPTIVSGKETLPIQTNQTAQTSIMNPAYEHEGHPATHLQNSSTKERMRKHKRQSKSMSELELEELKGLMDLGFSFSDIEENLDSRLARIVPGLRRSGGEGEVEVEVVRRPYLSEAWAVRDEVERKRLLRDWRVLKNGDEEDVKEHLRRWAHAVATTIK